MVEDSRFGVAERREDAERRKLNDRVRLARVRAEGERKQAERKGEEGEAKERGRNGDGE